MSLSKRRPYNKTPTTSLATKDRLSSIKRTGPTFDRSSTAPPPLTKTTSPGSSSSLRRLSTGLGQVKLTSSSPLATRPVISGTHSPSNLSSDPPSSSMSPQRQKGRPRSSLRPEDLSSEVSFQIAPGAVQPRLSQLKDHLTPPSQRESSPPPPRPREPSPEFERPPTPDFPLAPIHGFQRPPTPPLSSSSSHAAPRPPRVRQHSFSLVIEPKVPTPKPYVLGEPPLVRQPRRKVAPSSPTTQAQSQPPAPPRLPLSPSPTPGPYPSRRRRAESTTSTTIAELPKQDSQTSSASPAKKHKFEPFVNQILDPLPEYDALDEEESEDELGWDRSSVGDRAKRRTSSGPPSRRASFGIVKTGIKRVRRRASSTFEYSSFEAKRLGGAEKEDEQRLGMTGLPTPPTSRGAEEAEASRSLMSGNGSSSSSGAERSSSVVPFTSPHRERPQNQHNQHRRSYPPLNHPSRRTSFQSSSTHFSPTLSTTRQLTSEASWVPITYLTPEGFRREGTVVLPSEEWVDGPSQRTREEDGDGSDDELMLGPWGSRDDGLVKKMTSELQPQHEDQAEAEPEAEQDEHLEAGPLDPPPRTKPKSTFSSPLRPSSRSRLSRSKTIILDLPPLPALPEESEDELDCI
ncbi:BZ3500_MvSof-1268-A1-R1_Chr2-3g05293 [Microbotryum saponariae]|uniref:BZ3500_MvSof-1268-A1-R1_Chr2-3g05293 protein n=1 Tax=Microbotryum saponariae TaxID=289078 RepID=A0A2X0M9V9_9BASI|nr:BZ3500_MvSof-1268-A1-R1_Chr2-3g05293 [Microbotryum saponariae]SDA01134.1 BZ3501_MvSof-1269-A2-R1_Chr2-2g04966 [Microbotryum saponariae]